MAILGFFKKDKSKSSTNSQAGSTSPQADDAGSSESYVLPPHPGFLPSLGNGDDGYASSSASFVSATSSKSKIRLPFSKKSSTPSTSPLTRPPNQPRKSFNFSSDKLSLRIDTSPALHSAILPRGSPSTPTLSQPDPHTRPQPAVLQKPVSSNERKASGGLFGWRERKKSKPPKPDLDTLVLPPLPDDSFNLRSFRHVLPESSSESSTKRSPTQSPSSTSLVPPARPRGASVVSTDSSQRISVAAFREAQARRSSTNLASGSPSPTIRPVSVATSMISDIVPPRPPRANRPSASPSPVPGRGGKPKPSRQSTAISSSSETSSSEESDSDDGSPSRSRSRLSRQRTITKRSYGARSDLGHGASRATDYSHHQQTSSTRSELGHGALNRASHASPSPSRGPPPSAFPNPAEANVGTRSFSLYRRERASYSTSELSPSAAAQRASTVADANKRERAAAAAQQRKRGGGDSDTSESSSESDSSDEDAPLSALKMPKRPGSAFSHGSDGSSTIARKPLIDLNTKSNPLTGKPVKDDIGTEPPKGRKTLISPTDINSRLSQLTSAAGLKEHRSNSASKSEANLSSQTNPKPTFAESAKLDSPASTTTIIAPPRLESLKPVPPGARRASVSALSEILDSSPKKSSELRPVPVKDRVERDSGFRVVSRPQKSATTPPSFSPLNDLPRNSSGESPKVSHHRQSSSSTTFTVTSRPQNNITPLLTKPLVASPQNGSSVSGSSASTSASSSASRTAPITQKTPPQRPFAIGGKRQESPASSTGGSSNGKAPLTPMDGSDYFSPNVRGIGDSPVSSSVGATPPSAMKGGRGHWKRASVTFQEPPEVDKDETVRGRKSGLGQPKAQAQAALENREIRLRERRRSEAKAAIELANVINRRGPVEVEDDNEDPTMAPRIPSLNTGGPMVLDYSSMMQMSWQQQGMGSPMMGGMSPLPSMNGMPGMSMGMGVNPAQFMVPPPPPGSDATFLAAHRQAMLIAKQAYQYAVAQQAMAAAADEWERGSSVSAFTSPAPALGMGGGMGMNMGGYGMGGMNNMWSASPMFPPAPRSMYTGNTGGMSEAGWGTASVYGEAFGPSNRRSQMLNPQMRNTGSASVVGFPSYGRVESAGNVPRSSAPARDAPRPRTRTAPSNTPLPAQHRHSRGPPSSWKVGT